MYSYFIFKQFQTIKRLWKYMQSVLIIWNIEIIKTMFFSRVFSLFIMTHTVCLFWLTKKMLVLQARKKASFIKTSVNKFKSKYRSLKKVYLNKRKIREEKMKRSWNISKKERTEVRGLCYKSKTDTGTQMARTQHDEKNFTAFEARRDFAK